MKNQKVQEKGLLQKPGSSSAGTASNRRSRWDSAESKGASSAAAGSSRNAKDEAKLSAGKTSNDATSGSAAPIYDGRFGFLGGAAPSPGPGGHPMLPVSGDSPFRLRHDFAGPLPPPSYGFQDLERRTIALADGSFRSYFALPPDPPVNPDMSFPFGAPGLHRQEGDGLLGYGPQEIREFPPFDGGFGARPDHWTSFGPDGSRGSPEVASSVKRKYGEEDGFAWPGHRVMHHGNPNANRVGFERGSRERVGFLGRSNSPRRDGLVDDRLSKHARLGGDAYDSSSRRRRGDADAPAAAIDVNPDSVNRAFLRFSKMIYESISLRKNFLEDGKNDSLSCLACGRLSKSFGDMHALIMHTYHSQSVDLRVDHLGLHKALCVLMGWDSERVPETSKAYQSLPSDNAVKNREDLILWPPTVIIHVSNPGRRKDDRVESMGSREMDNKLKDLGITGGRSRTISPGTVAVALASDMDGLGEAERVAERLERDGRGRRGWARRAGGEKKGEVLYGYLAIAADLEQLDDEGKKRAVLRSRKDLCK